MKMKKMSKRCKWFAAAFAALAVWPVFAEAPALSWNSSLPDALASAGKTKKSVLILFTNLDGCPACRKLDEQVLDKPEVIRYLSAEFVPLSVNLSLRSGKNPSAMQLIEKYLATDTEDRPALPQAVVLSPDGSVAGRVSGFMPASFWLKELKFLRNPPPLFRAVHTGSEAEVRKLLADGADVNASGPSGVTALMEAVRRGSSADFIKALLTFHPDVNARDNRNAGALFYAVKADRVDLAELLLKEKANPLTPVGDTTPFHEAVRRGNLKMVRVFADAGVDLNKPSPAGYPPLIVAVIAENIPVLEFLVARGADPAGTDAQGNNGLHYGAMLSNRAVFQFFQLRGLDILTKNKAGKIPHQLAGPGDAFILKHSTPPEK